MSRSTLLIATLLLLLTSTLLTLTHASSSSLVDSMLQNHKIFVGSKSYCPYCAKVKQVLREWQIQYVGSEDEANDSETPAAARDVLVVELNQRDDGAEIQDILSQKSGSRTVPSVWLKGTFVAGGSQGVLEMVRNGQWKRFLDDEGIDYVMPEPRTEL